MIHGVGTFVSFSEGKHKNHTFKSLVFILSVSLYAHSLADVLSREDHVAGPTPEAADVPLFLQRQERLTLLDLVSTTRAIWRRRSRKKNVVGCGRTERTLKTT